MNHANTANGRWLRLPIYLLMLALCVLILASCAGKRTIIGQSNPRPFIADSAIAQAMAMQPPEGIDRAVFNKLRDELVRQLTLRAEGKLVSAAPSGAGAQVRDLAYNTGTGELTWSYANAGDYNIDGTVGVSDITPLAQYFGADTNDGIGNDGLETWLDGDKSGIIGVGDVTPLAMGFGFEVASYMVMSGDSPATAYTQTGSADFATRDTSTIPPTFAYVNTGLPSSGAYCKVVPRDSLSVAGIESLALNFTTGGVIISADTIGPDGGILDGGVVKVEFLAGTFADDTPLTLEDGPDSEYDEQVSDGFYIRGLPDSFTEPITVSIKLKTLPGEGDNYMLSLDEGEVWASSAGGVSNGEVHFSGETAGGWFTAAIPPTAPDSGVSSLRSVSAETDKTVYITVVNRRHYLMSNSGRFLVYFPAADEVLASAIADALDSAYTQIEALGLSWARRTTWPMEAAVKIRGADDPDGESFTSRFWGVNGAHLEFNTTNLSSSNDLAIATAGHELMHVAQYLYDNRNRVASSLSDGGWLWIDEATATWFEKEMPVSPSYIPNTVEQNLYAVEEALETNTQGHGYGESMFITYLARKQGDTVVGDIIKKKWDNYAPIEALKSVTSSLIDVDWQLFAEDFMKLAVYGAGTYPTSAHINAMQKGSYEYADASLNAGTVFRWRNAPHLSIRILRVSFTPAAMWADTDELVVKFYGDDQLAAPTDASYLIAKYASGQYTFLGSYEANEFRLKDLNLAANASGTLYFMLVNKSNQIPYQGSRTDTINLEVVREECILEKLQSCSDFWFRHQCDSTYQYGSNIYHNTGFAAMHRFKTIQWAGESFSSLETDVGDSDYIEGTVDPVARTVTFTYTETVDYMESDSWSNTVISHANLPLRVVFSGQVIGDIIGTACASYVTGTLSEGYMDYQPYFDPEGDIAWQYSNFEYLDNGYSWITLEFSPAQ